MIIGIFYLVKYQEIQSLSQLSEISKILATLLARLTNDHKKFVLKYQCIILCLHFLN